MTEAAAEGGEPPSGRSTPLRGVNYPEGYLIRPPLTGNAILRRGTDEAKIWATVGDCSFVVADLKQGTDNDDRPSSPRIS